MMIEHRNERRLYVNSKLSSVTSCVFIVKVLDCGPKHCERNQAVDHEDRFG